MKPSLMEVGCDGSLPQSGNAGEKIPGLKFIAGRNEEEEEARALTPVRRSAGIAPINHTLI